MIRGKAAAASLLVLTLACDSGTEPDPGPRVDRVTVDPSGFVLEVGETLDIPATARDETGAAIEDVVVTWSSSDDDVATVSSAGLVNALAEGPVTITATAGGRSGTSTGTIEPNTTITPAGGTLVSADGRVTLVFPPGAVSQPVRIGIQPSSGLPPERVVPGSAYRLAPAGLQFGAPVRLTIRYGDLPPALAGDGPYLWLHRYTDGEWAPVTAGASVDTVDGTVTAELSGFSDYAAVVSELAAELRQLSNRFFVLVTSPTAEVAIDVLALAAGLLAKFEHPLFERLVDPVLEVLTSTACSTFGTAVEVAQSTVVDDYQKLIGILQPLHVWTRITFEFSAPCDYSAQVDQIHTQKFAEFVDFYVGKLSQPDFTTEFERLIEEVAFVLKLRQDAQLLALGALEARIRSEAYVPLLVKLRESAYGACRGDGVHRHLGALRESILLLDDVPYTEDDILDDLQYCATRLTWMLEDGDQEEVGKGELGGGDAPGAVTREATSRGASAGTLTLGGDVRAFRCTDGGFAPDELLVSLAGTEVGRREAGSGGAFLASPLELDVETILSAAGIDPSETATHRLEVARSTSGCGASYVTSFDPVKLVTLDLEFPAAWSYEEDFNSGSPGPEWSRSATTNSPSGERFLGTFNKEGVSLSLSDLPPHSEVTIEFDFYVIGSWDGSGDPSRNKAPDPVEFWLGSNLLQRTTFSNDDEYPQAYPGHFPADSHPYATGATGINSLGYSTGANGAEYDDTVYRLSFAADHTGSNLVFTIEAYPTGNDEIWGIDNILVTVR